MEGSGERPQGPAYGGLPGDQGTWPPPLGGHGDPYGWGVPGDPSGNRPRRPRRSGRARVAGGVAAGLLAAATLGGVIGHQLFPNDGPGTSAISSGGGLPSNGRGSSGADGSGLTGSHADTLGTGPANAAAIAQKVDPGLVDVNTSIDYGAASGAGTGIVLTSSGEVLTNNHVIEGATSITATDVATGRRYSATVVGYDRAKDVAVLQLQGASGLATVTTGDSSTVATGEKVVAIGNANGAGGTPSYAGGTVVATHQTLTASDELTGTSERLIGMIETNADVIPGDSGGPLVDASGAVVGMDTAGSSTYRFTGASQTSGFAVPINTALSIARQIEARQASSTVHVGPTAFLGVEIAPTGSTGIPPFGRYGGDGGLGGTTATGATIEGVVPNSPAAAAGLAGGDTITGVDGHTVTSPTGLTNLLVQDRPGQKVTVQYTDATGLSKMVTVVLASGPAQ